jgi:ribosomal protein L21E
MPNFNDGDRVRIVSREQSEEDARAQMYYSYFGGLTGTIQKAYSKAEVAVEVDPESLTKEIRKRHEDVRDQMKTKWLEGLSEEGRSKLTEREKDFNLRFVILVAMADLEKAGPRTVKVTSAPSSVSEPIETTAAASAPVQAAGRKTLAELEAAEEAELLRRAQQN